MPYCKKIFSVIALISIIALSGAGFIKPPGDDDDVLTKKNLKIIRRNITRDDLEVLMTRYSREIGVTCNYCHVNTKGVTPERADFASDENPMKTTSRQMMRMTDRLNKKYFHKKNEYNILKPPIITCRTCHRGLSKPSNYKIYQ